MQRREFLKGGTAAYTIAAAGGLSVPLTIEPAKALENPYVVAMQLGKEVVALLRELNETAKLFGGKILAQLNGLGGRLDELQKSVGHIVEDELNRQELKTLVRDVRAQELSITETIEAMSEGQVVDASSVVHLAFAQRDLRNKLIVGGFGPSVYPFVGRSFLSESMMYIALGNQTGHFNASKKDVCLALGKYADAYASAASHMEASYKRNKGKWDELVKPVYVGSTKGMFSCSAYYLEFPDAALEDDERLHSRLRVRECSSDDYNPRGWNESTMLRYPNHGVFKEDQIYDRRDEIVQALRSAKRVGFNAKRLLDEFALHRGVSRDVFAAASEVRYPTPVVTDAKG